MSEEFEKDMPAKQEEDDVEAHGLHPAAAAPEAAATEEGPDVEAHGFHPKHKP